MKDPHKILLRRIRLLVGLFIFGLLVSGATAIPLQTEIGWLARLLERGAGWSAPSQPLLWLNRIHEALQAVGRDYPFLAYGTDWLAFAHFMIAVAFVGAWRDPLRNKWLLDFGLLACLMVLPYALAFGALRGIPLWWRLVDCSFGVFGAVPLWLARRNVQTLGKLQGSEVVGALKSGD